MAKTEDIAKQLANEGQAPKNEANRSNRKERVPFGTPRGKLEVRGKEPGYFYAWVNEETVDARLEEGFEFVTHDCKVGWRNVSAARLDNGSMAIKLPVGAGQTAFLMRQPLDYHEQDMAKYHKYVDSTEETLKRQSNSNGLQGNFEITRGK